MPTPFYHLKLADDLLKSEVLTDTLTSYLLANRAAFLFGNIAPDVQVISGQSRSSTHFFDLPLGENKLLPWEEFKNLYPQLFLFRKIKPDFAAFLTGYLCHLLVDWLWISEIFVPVFGLYSSWGTFSQRLYMHNVLRAYLDQRILPSIPSSVVSDLQLAVPKGWLPFVSDSDLYEWRNFLINQLQPGSKIRTVEVFAYRQGIAPEVYYRMIESEERMEKEIFSHIERKYLEDFYQRLLMASSSLLISKASIFTTYGYDGELIHENNR